MSDFDDFVRGPTLIGIAIVTLIVVVVGGVHLFNTWYMPAREQLQRETYQESRSFVRGKIQRLNQLRMQYADADSTHRAMIKQVALDEAVTVDSEDLPSHLRQWIHSLEN